MFTFFADRTIERTNYLRVTAGGNMKEIDPLALAVCYVCKNLEKPETKLKKSVLKVCKFIQISSFSLMNKNGKSSTMAF